MTLEVVPRQPVCKDIVDYYLTSILIYKLIKISKHADVRNSGSTEANPQAYSLIKAMVQNFITVGYMDIQKEYIVTRVCTYLMLLHNKTFPMPSLLRDLLSWYRIACLNNNRILCVFLLLSFSLSRAERALQLHSPRLHHRPPVPHRLPLPPDRQLPRPRLRQAVSPFLLLQSPGFHGSPQLHRGGTLFILHPQEIWRPGDRPLLRGGRQALRPC